MSSGGVDATSLRCLASSSQGMEQLSAAPSRVFAGNLAIDIISWLWWAEAVAGAAVSDAIVSDED